MQLVMEFHIYLQLSCGCSLGKLRVRLLDDEWGLWSSWGEFIYAGLFKYFWVMEIQTSVCLSNKWRDSDAVHLDMFGPLGCRLPQRVSWPSCRVTIVCLWGRGLLYKPVRSISLTVQRWRDLKAITYLGCWSNQAEWAWPFGQTWQVYPTGHIDHPRLIVTRQDGRKKPLRKTASQRSKHVEVNYILFLPFVWKIKSIKRCRYKE